jgi:hypothetical protein
MCGADLSASHVYLLPPHKGNPPAGCLEDRYSLLGRIWHHAIGGRYGVKACTSPAESRTECAAGSLNWSIFLASTVSKFHLLVTILNTGQALRLANYVYHRRDRPTAWGGTATLVHRDLVHHSVSVPGLTHVEASAVEVTLAGRPVKILAAYLSPSHPLIGVDLTACLGGGWPETSTPNTWITTRG